MLVEPVADQGEVGVARKLSFPIVGHKNKLTEAAIVDKLVAIHDYVHGHREELASRDKS